MSKCRVDTWQVDLLLLQVKTCFTVCWWTSASDQLWPDETDGPQQRFCSVWRAPGYHGDDESHWCAGFSHTDLRAVTKIQLISGMDVFWKLVKGELRQQLMSHAGEFNVDLMHQGDEKVKQYTTANRVSWSMVTHKSEDVSHSIPVYLPPLASPIPTAHPLKHAYLTFTSRHWCHTQKSGETLERLRCSGWVRDQLNQPDVDLNFPDPSL